MRADILDDRMLQLADKADDLQSFTGEVEVSDRVTTPQEQLDMTDDHESMQAQYFQVIQYFETLGTLTLSVRVDLNLRFVNDLITKCKQDKLRRRC